MKDTLMMAFAGVVGISLIILIYILPTLLIIGGGALIIKWLFF